MSVSFLGNLSVKEFRKSVRSTFAEVMIKRQVYCFLDLICCAYTDKRNQLPDGVVNCTALNSFKNKLNRFTQERFILCCKSCQIHLNFRKKNYVYFL